MDAFPPPPEKQATLANWRTPPFNRWSFQHVREIIPTAEVAEHPSWRWELPRATASASITSASSFSSST